MGSPEEPAEETGSHHPKRNRPRRLAMGLSLAALVTVASYCLFKPNSVSRNDFDGLWVGHSNSVELNFETGKATLSGTECSIVDSVLVAKTLSLTVERPHGSKPQTTSTLVVLEYVREDRVRIHCEGMHYIAYKDEYFPPFFDSYIEGVDKGYMDEDGRLLDEGEYLKPKSQNTTARPHGSNRR